MFHVRVEIEGDEKPEYVWDLSDGASVRKRYVVPWQSGGTLLVNGRRIAAGNVRRLQIFSNDGGRAALEKGWNRRADEAAAKGMFTFKSNGELWLNFADDKTDEFVQEQTILPLTAQNKVEQAKTISAFISYKWESEEHVAWVRQFATDLRAQGISTILDQWEVRYGQSFTEYMQKHINTADVILFVITPAAVTAAESSMGQGGALKFEVQMANSRRIQEGVRIIGVYRSGERPPHYLRDHRYADFRNDARYEESLRALINDLLGHVGPPPVGIATAPQSVAAQEGRLPRQSLTTSLSIETYTKSGLEIIRESLDGSAAEIKDAISTAKAFIRYTAGGAPKSAFSIGEQILLLFGEILALDNSRAIEKCRTKAIQLFGSAPAGDELTDQMRYLIDSALKLAAPPGPFK